MKHIRLLIVALVVSGALGAGSACRGPAAGGTPAASSTPAAATKAAATTPAAPTTIGAIVFLTGPQAPLGTEVQNAINLALEEINAGGGIGGAPLKVEFEDSKDQPRDALTAFRRLADGPIPVVLATGDVVSRALAPFAVETRLPLVATVAGGRDIAQAGGVFRVWIQATRQGEHMAAFAASNLKLTRVAVLRINNEFGQDSFDGFKTTFEREGRKILGVETFGVADRDVRAQIAKLNALKPQGLFVTGFGDGYGAAIKQIRESGFKGTLMTDATLAIPFFRQQTTPANEGAYLVTTLYDEHSEEPKGLNYTKRWRAKYNSDPSFTGAFAYDAIGMIATVLRGGARDRDQVRNGLARLGTYDGAIGQMRFTATGDLDFPLVIKKMTNGRQTIVVR